MSTPTYDARASFLLSATVVAGLSTFSVGAAMAQANTAEAVLTEIVVTATRTERSVNTVPISITALTQENMDQRGIKQIDDLARVTPGLNFQRNGFAGLGNRSQISIRGIESTVGASTTGIYIDDTPIQTRSAGYTSTSVFPAVFDLERVEVLRGPQGTLFGSGSEGGTVRFITPEPGLERYSSYSRTEVSSTKDGGLSYEGGAAIGGPIVQDQLGFRASAFYRHATGWIDRVDRNTGAMVDDDYNSSDSVVFRAAMTWAPTDELKITPSFYYQDLDAEGGSQYWEELSNPGAGRFRSGNALGAPSSDEFSLPALKIEYDFGPAQLISNTSYLDREALANPDYTQFNRAVTTGQGYPLIPGEYSKGYFIDEQKGFTQEIRLQSQSPDARLNWVIGAFYNKTRQTDVEIIESPFFAQMWSDAFPSIPNYIDWFGVPLGAMDSVFTDKQRTVDEQIAGFGQIDYAVTDQLKATVGLRYAKVDFSFRSENEGPFAGVGVNAGEQSEKPLTPKFGLSYQLDDANMLYASAAKGFRPGGAQRVPPTICAADLQELGITQPPGTYDADSVWSYELGTKNRLADGRLQLAMSAFWIDWSDIQQIVNLDRCGQSFVANLGKAVSKGVDVSVDTLIGDAFTLRVAAGYTKAEFTETIMSGNAITAIDGQATTFLSPFTATVTGQYDFALAGSDAYMRLDYDYASAGQKPNFDVFGVDSASVRRPQTNLLAARAGTQFKDISVSLFVDNLLNSSTRLSHARDVESSSLFTATTFRPRTVGLTASYRY